MADVTITERGSYGCPLKAKVTVGDKQYHVSVERGFYGSINSVTICGKGASLSDLQTVLTEVLKEGNENARV